MADQWFDIASLDHFWVRRRFEVVQKLCGNLIRGAKEIAEIGCGNGLLQRQIELTYGQRTTGFDLNEVALNQNVSKQSPLYCYNIFDLNTDLKGKFNLIFLFDVLEHVADEDDFLKALLFHLSPEGKLVINVPAGEWAFSPYDVAAGHVRRYTSKTLRSTSDRNRLDIDAWTYWGLPLAPSLVVRKLWLMGKQEQGSVIAAGFDTRSAWINKVMWTLSQCEWIPQKVLGTSLLAVLHRREAA